MNTLMGSFVSSGTNNLSGASAFICFNPLSGCLLLMTTLFVFSRNKHEFYIIDVQDELTVPQKLSTKLKRAVVVTLINFPLLQLLPIVT